MVVRRSAVVLVRIAVITLTLLGLLLSLAIPAAQAALTPALPGPYGSAVPGLGTDQLAITQSWPNQVETGLGTLPAVQSFQPTTLGGAQSTIAQVGSVYGLAYHNGQSFDPANPASARQVSPSRLFVGAYGKRLSGFGTLGPGGIYAIDQTSGAVTNFFTVPNANACAGNAFYGDCHSPIDENNAADGPGGSNVDYDFDWYMADYVGKTSLGDLEVSPDGRFLYAANLNTNAIQRIKIDGTNGAASDAGTVGISVAPAGTRLFGMDFNPTDGSLSVGLITPNRVTVAGAQVLQAYVVRIADPATGGDQTVVLTQMLDEPGAKENAVIDERNRDARIKDQTDGWYDWNFGHTDRPTSNPVRYPQPMLADIEFSSDGQTMALGFRDRSGDPFFYRSQPTGQFSVIAQGDTLVYRGGGSSWTLQTRSFVNAATNKNQTTADVLNDDYFAGNDGTTARAGDIPHAENHMGALARILDGPTGTQPFTYTSRVVLSALDQVQDRTNGVTTYNLQNPGPVFGRVAALQITDPPPLGQSGQGKAAALGDIEPLAAASFVGDRVWKDTNANGLQDALEPGVAGVRLVLVDGVTGDEVATAVTAADGTYTFAVQASKAYRIRPVLPPGLIPTLQDMGSDDALDSDLDTLLKTLPVPPQLRDRTTTTYDLGLIDSTQGIGEIGNFVWDDRDGDGIQDTGEPGLNGVTVSVAWGQP